MPRLTIDINDHRGKSDRRLLQRILARLDQLGAQMSELSASLNAMKERVLATVVRQQGTIEDLTSQLMAALADDAADEATIAAKQEEVDQLKADTQAAIDEINAIATEDTGPGPETPEEPAPPVEGAPGEGTPAEGEANPPGTEQPA